MCGEWVGKACEDGWYGECMCGYVRCVYMDGACMCDEGVWFVCMHGDCVCGVWFAKCVCR